MSTSYVIPNISYQKLLRTAEQLPNLLITDEGNNYLLRTPIDPHYSLQKRINLGKTTNIPPDNIQQGNNTASIRLYKTEDTNNSWFEGTAVSINHPEIILNKLTLAIKIPWYSEHDEEYWTLIPDEDI
jgi:hypothetical protein